MKVALFYASAGHGHQRVAEAIAGMLSARGLGQNEMLLKDILALTPWFFKKTYPAIYYNSIKYLPAVWGWFYELLDHESFYAWLRPLRSLGNQLVGGRLKAETLRFDPDVIVATHFYPAEFFSRLRRKGKIQSKLVTVITDYYPHTFWINPGTDYYWVMGEEGEEVLRRRGVPPDRILAGGIPVPSEFQPSNRKADIRQALDLSADRLTILQTSGSFGLGPQAEVLRALDQDGLRDRIQSIVVCGCNLKLKEFLEKEKFGFPVKIFGFVDFMADLMEASDLIIAKPGGATATEALVKGVPMVVFRPIPGQETENARILKDRNAAFFMQEPHQIQIIVRTLLQEPELLEAKRRAIHLLAKPNATRDLVDFILTGRKP